MSAVQAAGSVFEGVFNRNAARRRATILKRDAQEALALGAIEAETIAIEGQLEAGAAEARAGASGFTAESAVAQIGQLAARYDYNAKVARYNAHRRATAMLNDAHAEKARGNLMLLKGLSDAAGHAADAMSSGSEGGS